MKKYNWIIAVCNSANDDIYLFKFIGSTEEIKKKLLSMVTEDRNNDKFCWEYGCKDLNDVTKINPSKYYAYGCYVNYHIDYIAEIEELINKIK